jgi:hypothetical protein
VCSVVGTQSVGLLLKHVGYHRRDLLGGLAAVQLEVDC